MTKPQTYANHRAIPGAAFIAAALVLAAAVVWQGVRLVQVPSVDAVFALLVALALVAMLFISRRNAQIVQDRIIRLEMHLRLEHLLPSDRRGDIARLSVSQLVALRFASDAEMPALVQEVLAQSLGNDAIKRKITAWQADWLRV